MFENIRSGYARLLPGGPNDAEDREIIEDLGIYEDEESRASQRLDGGNLDEFAWPSWLEFLPSLSFRERLLGCATCMICGYILSFGSFMRMKDLMVGNPVPLVVHVTIGNLLSLAGTLFLTGPQSQMKRMFHKSRKLASVFYLGSLVATLFLLLLPHFFLRGLILFFLMIGQYIAIFWYCLSYIPYAREFMSNMCRRMIAAADDD